MKAVEQSFSVVLFVFEQFVKSFFSLIGSLLVNIGKERVTRIRMNRPLKNTRVVHSTCSMRSSKCVMSANKMRSMAPSMAIHPDKNRHRERLFNALHFITKLYPWRVVNGGLRKKRPVKLAIPWIEFDGDLFVSCCCCFFLGNCDHCK